MAQLSWLRLDNLRKSDDCHGGTWIMFRLELQEVLYSDAHRVHRFVVAVSGPCRDCLAKGGAFHIRKDNISL